MTRNDARTDSNPRRSGRHAITRRGWLRIGGATVLGALAGCPGSNSDTAPATSTDPRTTTTGPTSTGDPTTAPGPDGTGTTAAPTTTTTEPATSAPASGIKPMASYAMDIEGTISVPARDRITLAGVARVDRNGNSEYEWTIGNESVETEVRTVVRDGTSYTVVDGECTGGAPGLELGQPGTITTNESSLSRVESGDIDGESVTTYAVQDVEAGGDGTWNATIHVSDETRYPLRWQGALRGDSDFNATITADFRGYNSSFDIQVPDGC